MSPPMNTDSRLVHSNCTFIHSSKLSVALLSSFSLFYNMSGETGLGFVVSGYYVRSSTAVSDLCTWSDEINNDVLVISFVIFPVEMV